MHLRYCQSAVDVVMGENSSPFFISLIESSSFVLFLFFCLGFLTETGKTRASIILSTGNEMSLQVTQIRIKVSYCLITVLELNDPHGQGLPTPGLKMICVSILLKMFLCISPPGP